jgi:thiamine-phosphate pyrophosphorylase
MADEPRRRLICLVTDRRRLCATLGKPINEWPTWLEEQMTAAVAAGIDLIQWRERDLDAGPSLAFIRGVSGRLPGLRSRLVVNDRLDVAVAAGAAGVHLRERSFAVSDARSLAPPGLLVGRSVHEGSAPESYRDASYVIAGTVLPSPSKPGGPLLGLDGLRRVVQAAGATPVLPIGGLTLGAVPELLAAGVSGFAAIGWFVPEGPERLDRFVQKQVAALRFAFDSWERGT